MSFDFSIDVCIRNKLTGENVTGSDVYGYDEICWWNSSMFLDIPFALFRICSKYTGEEYKYREDLQGNAVLDVPKAAMREICSYIYSRCCVPSSELTEERDWYWWDGYEVTNLAKAEELKNFLCSLDQIENNNTDTGIADDLIHDQQKREAFKKDPQGYEFLFRLDYHYCRPRKD
ncbi:MAG: hypothetical protein KBA55_05780 [Ruminococcus sp.]|nr:hypothetical protein [Ruminococcus sp.]